MNLRWVDVPGNQERFEVFLRALLCMKTNGIPRDLPRREIIFDIEQVMFGLDNLGPDKILILKPHGHAESFPLATRSLSQSLAHRGRLQILQESRQ